MADPAALITLLALALTNPVVQAPDAKAPAQKRTPVDKGAAEQPLPGLQKDQPKGRPSLPPRAPRRRPPGANLGWFATQIPIWIWLVINVRNQEKRRRELAQQLADEEENKTPYPDGEVMDNWEFKIVRNDKSLFDTTELMNLALQEEARGGWQLVEKFDGNRMRLKRRGGTSPAVDGYDPYRTAVLVEQCRAMVQESQKRSMRIAGIVLFFGGILTLIFGALAEPGGGFPGILAFILAFICGIAALIGLVALIVFGIAYATGKGCSG